MRPLALIATVGLLAGLHGVAFANDQVNVLVAEGEALAKKAEFSQAIEKWKAADTLQPRAKHACLIGLAYTRRELWPQAEIFFAACRSRAGASDPVPNWLDAAEKQLQEKLANAAVAAVELKVLPVLSGVKLKVSSFAPDEWFAPRTIHLALGQHVVTATAPGYGEVTQVVDVKTKASKQVTLQLVLPGTDSKPTPEVVKPPEPRTVEPAPTASPAGQPLAPAPMLGRDVPRARSASPVPWLVIGGGSALVAVGAIAHVAWFKPIRDDLQAAADANDRAAYDKVSNTFDTRRNVVIGMYALGAATLATGLVLKYTVYKDKKEAPMQLGAAFSSDSALLSLEWRR